MKVRSRVRVRRHIAEIILYAMFAVTLMIGVNFILRDKHFEITGVTVNGAQSIPTASLVVLAEEQLAGAYAGLVPHSNRFLYPKNRIIKSMQTKFPRIENIALTLDTGMLSIAIKEYPEEYLWCRSDLNCLAFIQALAEKDVIVTRVLFLEAEDVKLVTALGWYILYNNKNNHDETLTERVNAALSSEVMSDKDLKDLEYIDLRFGNKIYYKFK